MTTTSLLYTMFMCGFLGLIIPGASYYAYLEYRKRINRLPEATKWENLNEKIADQKADIASYKDQLGDMAQDLLQRDYAVKEMEECLMRKRQILEELQGLEPRQIELESVNQKVADKNEQLAALTQEISQSKFDLEQLKLEIRVMPLQKQALEQELLELTNKVNSLKEANLDLENRADGIRARIAELEPRSNILKEEIENKEKRQRDIAEQIQNDWQKLLELKSQLPPLESEKTKLNSDIQQLQNAYKDLQVKHHSVSEEIDRSKNLLAETKSNLVHNQQLNSSIISEIQKGKTESAELQKTLGELHQKIVELKTEVSSLETLKAHLQGVVTTAQSIEEEALDKSLEDLLTEPECLKGRQKALLGISETMALENLYDRLDSLNLRYSRRVLKSFHTNLKISHISPMVALAGISGTGKSELPKRYAESMGIHFLQVAVQPRWDSPQDLFGFYNYLEKRYKATELARAMVRLDQWNWANLANGYKDKILMVLLDEMNLARVEYYFSEFLSRLEGRKSVDESDRLARQPVEIELELGKKRDDESGKRVFPSQNVLFVGTMNEDESTQSMSDKVIDRAPVLRFARPKKLVDRPPETLSLSSGNFLPFDTWKSWRRDISDVGHDVRDHLEEWIGRLNKALDTLGRPFGHRLNQAILAYVANHPDMTTDESVHNARKAFADQLEQRIFPKLRGVEMEESDNERAYKQILELVKEDIQDDELGNALEESRKKILFSWVGVQREEEK